MINNFKKKMKIFFLKCLIILTITKITQNSKFFDVFMPSQDVDTFLRSGTMKGYFTYNEFWTFFKNLRNDTRNRKYLTDKIEIGKTYEGRPIYGYYISDNARQINAEIPKKNILLFTGLHHAREPLTLTMIMLMTIEILKNARETKHNKFLELLRDNIIFFIPAVNTDSYVFINKYWNGSQGREVLMIRKNRHVSPSCNVMSGGVDLNRNYDFKFGMNESGSSSNPCAEDYRGATPFSEPETQAIKNFVDKHENIVSGVNIHSYGNAWIYPFNFVADGGDLLLKKKKRIFYDFFKEFESKMKLKKHKALFGNAAFTLDYPTNGEAGDWLTGAKNILNLDIELGNLDKRSEGFYPPIRLIDRIVRYNWIIMKDFLFSHIIDLGLKKVIMNPHDFSISFEIFNKAISGLIDFEGLLKPLFNSSHQPGKFKMQYALKNFVESEVETVPVIGGMINTTLKGRHILDLKIIFDEEDDYKLFNGMHMVIKRNEGNFRNYPHQRYTFRVAKYKNKKV